MKQNIAKLLLILSISSVVMIVSGCGARGDLYIPEEAQSAGR